MLLFSKQNLGPFWANQGNLEEKVTGVLLGLAGIGSKNLASVNGLKISFSFNNKKVDLAKLLKSNH